MLRMQNNEVKAIVDHIKWMKKQHEDWNVGQYERRKSRNTNRHLKRQVKRQEPVFADCIEIDEH